MLKFILSVSLLAAWFKHIHHQCCSNQPFLKIVLFGTCVPPSPAAVLVLDILILTIIATYKTFVAIVTTVEWVFTSRSWVEIFNDDRSNESRMAAAEGRFYDRLAELKERRPDGGAQ